jgi:FkbM family methyltransferase
LKLRDLPFLLGFRAKPKTYGHQIRSFDLPTDGRIDYAQWLHPGESDKAISQAAIDELRKFVQPGDGAIDIGAHTGDSTIPIAVACGAEGFVLALEPNPYVFPVLKMNSELNLDKTTILPLMIAATPEDREYVFRYSDNGFCNGGRFEGLSEWRHGHLHKVVVQGRNLQALLDADYPSLLPRVRLVKIDAEGQDLDILTGLSRLLLSSRPYIRLEVFRHSGQDQRGRLFSFLSDRGYAVWRVGDEGNFRAEKVSAPREMQRWRHFDIFCTPDH